ncbi:RNA polymerase-associated protein RapA [Oleiphilus messinensis]|uniref:RNA polymerase-associated protein RapA n=1 Tax=Oleiphilus messinensis TaxID=141451 RepID=A0A1Y0ICC8_9GAMM|nr:RNA polymerase-associated protein RapA [Oleiphilus messinensis]ARU58212.1 RNA polymerase-associated protein RapA [Oleiphilus messinensis]
MSFSIGQRWVSLTESHLGLGMIAEFTGRQVTVSFPAAGEMRVYASNNAPLSRVLYGEGDTIRTADNRQLLVTAVEEFQGILKYTGTDEYGKSHTIREVQLDCFTQLIAPQQRLFSGHYNKKAPFQLRVETLNLLNDLQQSNAKGLIGSRTSHLPHQIYIASEVARRHAPRVLLADEVGLGKTIEAGMILHYQLHTGRASRVLIVVPDSLVHQWLVEMLRRFNLKFSIFDKARFDAIKAEGQENPFEAEQLVLTSLSFLAGNDQVSALANAAGWDMLIVDEAHHLHWDETQSSREYQCVEALSAVSEGLLLLTATPEQIGLESHFARLRLLDPSRFYDLEVFKAEEAGYQKLNEVVQRLQERDSLAGKEPLEDDLVHVLRDYLGDEAEQLISGEAANLELIIEKLLDRHGTGRVLFRNTRSAVKGFPERVLHTHALKCPALYEADMKRFSISGLTPERNIEDLFWLKIDPRVTWLTEFLKENRQEKVLVICAKESTASELEQHLRLYEGVRSAAFTESMSIIERDRAGAYFAETENGAQVLICSEIGSEGRNFQFSRHLILFDLPLNPDLLEQRIGRLDRIGQVHDINIHVPFIENTSQQYLYRWYKEGMNLFARPIGVAYSIYEQFAERLEAELCHPSERFEALLQEAAAKTESTLAAQEEGRDKLLELHSCNEEKAAEVIALIEDAEEGSQLQEYMENVFNLFGVDCEYHSENARILRPTEHMHSGYFPGVSDEDGTTITYSRKQALSRDDMQFVSWEHPMVVESMEMILNSEFGNASLATMAVKALKPGTLLLEAVFTINCVAPKRFQIEQFLPISPIRVLVDINGQDLSQVVPHDKLNTLCDNVKKPTGQALLKQVKSEIETMLEHATGFAEKQLPDIREQAQNTLQLKMMPELERILALKKINPSIRDEEVEYFRSCIEQGARAIGRSAVQLQALRLIVNT